MTVKQLEEMDFFELKLLAEKKGTLYIRDGEIFIYQGPDKIKIDPENVFVTYDQEQMGCLDVNKNATHQGCFYFWQKDDKFILNFVAKEATYLIKGGNATDSL